jgi:hypothetical protein
VKATVAERTRRQQTRGHGVPGHGVPGHGHPAGMAHPATRLRLVADRGRLLPREQVMPRREPARRVAARPGRIPYNPVPERTPLRLTRRGRVVVAATVMLLVGTVALALALWAPTG